ncbi:molybdenum cofactor sulfurase-like [Lineus longissimus]|uniref:molybdenum cofactor sulfurase-like n=1 Tax=Lineus longissimus TaxID=88925 RepID=UPI00315E0267
MAASINDEYLTKSRLKFDISAHNKRLECIRKTEFARLGDAIYLDHTGATLYAKSQIEAYSEDLLTHVYGNPHSLNASSQLTTDLVDQVRFRILQHFNTTPEEYSIIFTSGATASLKLLAESFDFVGDLSQRSGTRSLDSDETAVLKNADENDTERGVQCEDGGSSQGVKHCPSTNNVAAKDIPIKNNNQFGVRKKEFKECELGFLSDNSNAIGTNGCLCYVQDSHTSVVGMREVATSRGAAVFCLAEKIIEEVFTSSQCDEKHPDSAGSGDHARVTSQGCLGHGQLTLGKGESTQRSELGLKVIPNDNAPETSVIQNGNNCNTETYQKLNKNAAISVRERSRSEPIESVKVRQQFQGQRMVTSGNGLFVFPPQSNFSGQKYPLDWIGCVQNCMMGCGSCDRWYVALDAATFVATNPLDLSVWQPDFVVLSFYKMFGFPTGIGALIVKKTNAHLLQKAYFGGGTVLVNLSKERFHVPRPDLAERFEDGTIAFLDILALKHGFDTLAKIGGPMTTVSHHTYALAKHVFSHLRSMTHPNGAPVTELYTGTDFSNIAKQGNIVNFNVLRSDGSYVGFSQVDRLAQIHNIHLRIGCFCNIGACQRFLGLTDQHVMDNFKAGHVCGDDMDLVNGKPTGSVRISFGYMSTLSDTEAFLQFVRECFVEKGAGLDELVGREKRGDKGVAPAAVNNSTSIRKAEEVETPRESEPNQDNTPTRHLSNKSIAWVEGDNDYVDRLKLKFRCQYTGRNTTSREPLLSGICIYPVKSCGALKVNQWELSTTGLMYDRGWMIVNQHGTCLSQKREPKLCLIKPYLDLNENLLVLTIEGEANLLVPIDLKLGATIEGQMCPTTVCGDKISGVDCGLVASDWVSLVLGRPGSRLIRQCNAGDRRSKLKKDTDGSSRLSFTNESQFLLVNETSSERLLAMMQNGSPTQSKDRDTDTRNLIDRFRANFVISGADAFEEDAWSKITIGEHNFMSLGECNRCQMICLDQETGVRSREPLMTLAAFRGANKVTFGIHLKHTTSPGQKVVMRVGDQIKIMS